MTETPPRLQLRVVCAAAVRQPACPTLAHQLCPLICLPVQTLLPAAGIALGIPQTFVMKNTTKFADPMLAFSDSGGQIGD
jgi:hypothetical protein